MLWDEEARKLASFSDPPRTALTLLTLQNTSAGLCVLGSSRRSRTAIGLFPKEERGPKKRHYHAWLRVIAAQCSGQQMRCVANVACIPRLLHRGHLRSAHAVGRDVRGSPGMMRRSLGSLQTRRIRDTGTARGERPVGHNKGDERVAPSPSGRRGLAAI